MSRPSLTLRLAPIALSMAMAGCHDAKEEAYQARRAAAEKTLVTVQDQLKAIEAAWPDTTTTPARACDDAALRAIAPTEAAQMVVSIAWPVVQRHAARHSDDSSPPSPTHHLFERLALDSPFDIEDAAKLLHARPLWGVWRATDEQRAAVVDPSAMTGGHAQGTFVLFDGPKATPLCWLPVSAESSDKVEYRAADGESDAMKKEKADLAVSADLAIQTEGAIRAAVSTITAVAKLPEVSLREQ